MVSLMRPSSPASLYRAEPATTLILTNGEAITIGFVVNAALQRQRFLFAINAGENGWQAFDVRRLPGLGEGILVGVGPDPYLRPPLVAAALGQAFPTRMHLAALASAPGVFTVAQVH